MSEHPTPRTDEAEFTYEDYDSHDTVVCVKVVPSAMARQIERELAAANEARAQIGPLKARIAELNALLDSRGVRQ
jgi:hypothetical protein